MWKVCADTDIDAAVWPTWRTQVQWDGLNENNGVSEQEDWRTLFRELHKSPAKWGWMLYNRDEEDAVDKYNVKAESAIFGANK